MAKIITACICENCIIDSVTNNSSIINLYEQLNTVGPLPIQATFKIFSLWKKTITDGTDLFLKIEILKPDGQIVDIKAEQSFKWTAPRHRWIFGFLNFPFDQIGTYSFKIKCRQNQADSWDDIYDLPLDIVLLENKK